MISIKLIKQLFKAEVIEVAALRAIAESYSECPESDNSSMYAYYLDQADELGCEYGFNEDDWQAVDMLEGLDIDHFSSTIAFMWNGCDIAKAAGMEDGWNY